MSIPVRVGASGILLGVLAAFVGWALQWGIDSRARATYGMPDPVTTVRLGEGPESPTSEAVAVAAADLRAFLAAESLTLIVASVGEGRPAMIVGDPNHVLSWFPAGAVGDQPVAYLFEGTYSAQRWTESGVTPLLPAAVRVGGIIPPPRGVGDIQFALALGSFRLPAGDYVVNTADPVQLQKLMEILGRLGLEPHSSVQLPLEQYLVQDPFFVTTSLLVVLGLVCAAMFWVVFVRSRHRELVIRRRHGATLSMLVGQQWLRGLPALGLGLAVGAAASGVVVVLVGRESLRDSQYGWLLGTTAAGLILAAVAWLIAVCVAVVSPRKA